MRFTCAGKAAGFLDHRAMVHPPELERDFIFIVVPDTWTFYDRASWDAVTVSPSAPILAEQPRPDPHAKFLKRKAKQGRDVSVKIYYARPTHARLGGECYGPQGHMEDS